MKKGFTLVELLAVIIILAVIALIATPIVLDVVDSAKKSAFESSANGIIDAVRLKSAENMLDGSSIEATYAFPSTEIEIEGEQPKGGQAKVDKQGRVAIAVYNDKWCAVKGIKDVTVTLVEYVEGECVLPTEEDDIVVITGDPIKDKITALVLDENGACKTDGTTYTYMGGCYIKASASTTLANHVWYNGFLWRIMGINNLGTENESIKMITEENVTAIPYNVKDNTNLADSHADKWLNEYFYNKLSNENNLKTNIIVDGTFCQGEATTESPSRTECTNGTELTRKVGLLTIDEYNLSGGTSSYLKNSQYFWTMSPYDSSYAWYVDNFGVTYNIGVNNTFGLRPVINVNTNAAITSGNGTLSDYYVLGENKGDTDITGTIASVKIGEYVSLNNKNYRVVENGDTTKLILDSYYQEDGTNYTMKYGDDNVFTASDRTTTESDTNIGIGYKLNTDVLNWLTAGDNQERLKDAILPSVWYQNDFVSGNSYEVSLNETNPTRSIENVQVGLIRVGEMLSGQSYSMLTKNGTVVSNRDNVSTYWTMTPSTSSSSVWFVNNVGYAYSTGFNNTYTLGLRPVINVNSNLKITGGNGTLGHEYIIEVK